MRRKLENLDRRMRSKTYRKKEKRRLKERRHRNKKLIQKYPWLRAVDWYTMCPTYDKRNDLCGLWDDLPRGWLRAFGVQMCDEIQILLKKHGMDKTAYIEQAKEKYGGMRIYMAAPHEVQEVIDIYSAISENVCCMCGRPHVPMLNLSWVSPYCKSCFEKRQKRNSYFYQKPYETYTPENKEHWRIQDKLTWHKYSTEGSTDYTIDISERVRQIERRWNEKHPDDMV